MTNQTTRRRRIRKSIPKSTIQNVSVGVSSSSAAPSADPASHLPQGLTRQLARELFVAHHATQGFSQAVLAEIQNFPGGIQPWIQNQLGLVGTISDTSLDQVLADPFFANLNKTTFELVQIYGQGVGQLDVSEFARLGQGATVLRGVLSKKQLFERVVEFWTDHLNVWINKDDTLRLLKPVDDRDVIRPNALGRFSDLLKASAKSAAMSHYLNGEDNTKNGPNENYAREVMELHTLGVDVLYQEVDIVNAAKLFTGWNYVHNNLSPNLGDFEFRGNQHVTDPVITVLGVQYSQMDVTDGETFLDDLAALPETAEFVCGKLILWLLGNPLPSGMHTRVVNKFLSTGGDIALTVAEIFSDDIIDVCTGLAPAFKRPSRFVFGFLRQLEADMGASGQGYLGGILALAAMGQAPFDWAPPTGFPISEQAWGSDTYSRWAVSNAVMANVLVPFGVVVPDAVLDAVVSGGVDPTSLRDSIELVMTGFRFSAADRALLFAYIDELDSSLPNVTIQQQRIFARDAIAFAASLPSYQFE